MARGVPRHTMLQVVRASVENASGRRWTHTQIVQRIALFCHQRHNVWGRDAIAGREARPRALASRRPARCRCVARGRREGPRSVRCAPWCRPRARHGSGCCILTKTTPRTNHDKRADRGPAAGVTERVRGTQLPSVATECRPVASRQDPARRRRPPAGRAWTSRTLRIADLIRVIL